jgi:NAD(P)-dependent dehydrogenase (short-subunit alcohol dehydrogenase family)
MQLGIDGDSAIVTASSSGLGKATATALASEGVNVVVNGRTEDRLQDAVAEIREQARGDIVAVRGDITEAATWSELVSTAVEEFGGLDHLVTSAGGVGSKPFLDTSLDEWRDACELLLISVAGIVREAADHLRAGGGGTLTTITSVYSKEAVESYVLSNAVRMGVLGLTKTVSRELAPAVRANSVLPGWHATSLTLGPVKRGVENGRYDSIEDGIRARLSGYDIPLDRMGEPRRFGKTVAFLCSEHASYITGVALPVDGGLNHSNV